jgi:hypothetical protein
MKKKRLDELEKGEGRRGKKRSLITKAANLINLEQRKKTYKKIKNDIRITLKTSVSYPHWIKENKIKADPWGSGSRSVSETLF